MITAGSGRRAFASPQRLLVADPDRCFLALLIAGVAVALLAVLPQSMLQDTWLALVGGREIAHSGIPHHVTLTSLAHGRGWEDQQWLAQLWMYGLYRLGGLGLVGVVNVGLIVAGLAGAAAAAIRLGAHPRAVLLAAPLPVIIAAFTNEVRTQPYAYPLFVLTVYLLAADSRRPTRAVFWCLPAVVLWANLHGSVVLGAGLVALRGLTLLRLDWRRALALVVTAPAALLVTPYGPAILSYYRRTLIDPGLRRYLIEWQPVTADALLAVLFFLLAGAAVWAMGRYGRAGTLWERAAALLLAAGAIVALRNVVWFALAMLVVLPVWIDGAVRARERRGARARPRLNATLLVSMLAVAALLAARALSAGAGALTPTYPAGALAAVRASLQSAPGARVYAEETYADWLLWELPSLRGRVAYDASFEVLSPAQLTQTFDFATISGVGWLRAARGYRVLVVSAPRGGALVPALHEQGGARVVYDRDDVAVLERG